MLTSVRMRPSQTCGTSSTPIGVTQTNVAPPHADGPADPPAAHADPPAGPEGSGSDPDPMPGNPKDAEGEPTVPGASYYDVVKCD